MALLEPFPADVMAVDRWGNTSVHAAAARCDYDTLKLLARRANLDIATVMPESVLLRLEVDHVSSTHIFKRTI